jgi:hypothetical protein
MPIPINGSPSLASAISLELSIMSQMAKRARTLVALICVCSDRLSRQSFVCRTDRSSFPTLFKCSHDLCIVCFGSSHTAARRFSSHKLSWPRCYLKTAFWDMHKLSTSKHKPPVSQENPSPTTITHPLEHFANQPSAQRNGTALITLSVSDPINQSTTRVYSCILCEDGENSDLNQRRFKAVGQSLHLLVQHPFKYKAR